MVCLGGTRICSVNRQAFDRQAQWRGLPSSAPPHRDLNPSPPPPTAFMSSGTDIPPSLTNHSISTKQHHSLYEHPTATRLLTPPPPHALHLPQTISINVSRSQKTQYVTYSASSKHPPPEHPQPQGNRNSAPTMRDRHRGRARPRPHLHCRSTGPPSTSAAIFAVAAIGRRSGIADAVELQGIVVSRLQHLFNGNTLQLRQGPCGERQMERGAEVVLRLSGALQGTACESIEGGCMQQGQGDGGGGLAQWTLLNILLRVRTNTTPKPMV